ncbi:hypothetical protein HDU97_005324 [Phlyctochytrium planicorne]|nr:hypothetical protein HDU97_005324 [Phlyctochytrium planicorne]
MRVHTILSVLLSLTILAASHPHDHIAIRSRAPSTNTPCIETLFSCGALSPEGFGTIVQCSNNRLVQQVICNDNGRHACTLIGGFPFCTDGDGNSGQFAAVRPEDIVSGKTALKRRGPNILDTHTPSFKRRLEVRDPANPFGSLTPSMPKLIPSKPKPITTKKPKTTTKPSPTPKPTPPDNDNSYVDPNTSYGAQGLTRCQYNIILSITSVYETSNPNLGFDTCGNWNDGQGISAGFIQFTTSSGSALQVVQTYLSYSKRSNPPIASFVGALQKAKEVGNGGQTWGQGYMDGLWGFCDAWQEANTNDAEAFHSAQMKIQSDGYLAPNKQIVDELGIKTALGVGQMMDTAIQLGGGAVSVIARNAGWSPSQGASESDFLRRYLDARIQYLNNLGGAYPGTKYRVESYRHMLQKGNLEFDGGQVEALDNGGYPMIIKC